MVSIITVNFNGYKDTCELIDSLQQYETYPYEVVVVDNASRNEEGKRLQACGFDKVTVVCSDQNLGFAGGNNLGFQYAKGDYILYMNNDMLIDRPFLEVLIDRLNSSSNIGAVSPKLLYVAPAHTIQYAGFTPLSPILLRNETIGIGEKDEGQRDQARETAFLHGACMLTSRKVLEDAGQMTEVYFLFYEEFDWSMQLKRAGYSLWYEPAAAVYHKESMSIPKATPLRQYYMTRSRLLFARRNLKGMDCMLSCLYQMGVVMPKNVLTYMLKGRWQMVCASWKGMVKGISDKTQ
ncbi:glycosyltransferase family 2 protein [Parabacteroides sp. PF5-6]|uniref:glycosyltransferase family 2 protein n=1 Tax=Parabacteroides sp. PF5-6 TaxID=1742403 RepID=UPI00240600DF|nr:glycosyltransferase family 2 protein [Parabacteroides sp. PF5-6]MDF9831730.1 GT2 family glycosyltransferase [Parabacteroides sp. PF5-6]